MKNITTTSPNQHDSVTIVGVGITSIMVALALFDLGYQISLYSKGPDPRLDRDAEQYGATGNGRSARFITGLEGKPHLFEGAVISDSANELHTQFTEGGWLTKAVSEYPEDDQEWLKNRYSVSNVAEHIESLYNNYYVKFGHESIKNWIDMSQSKPFLFENTDITDHEQGVLVLCNSNSLLEATIEAYKKHGFLKQVLTGEEVVELAPVYENTYHDGNIAGGLLVDGFAFNIHSFIENSINYLEEQGIQFIWNEEILGIEVDESNRVLGLQTQNKGLIESDHYSVNPGAYGNDLLANTPAKGKICGVAGRWLIIPRPDGFTIPTKILTDSRVGPSIGDNNLTPFMDDGRAMLAVSGGSVFVGSNSHNLPSPDICKMIDIENERILQLYLTSHYNALKEKDEVKAWTNTCLRSFTHDDQPVHEVMETSRGGSLSITAGTNTGTTALAPYLAHWTTQALTKKGN